VCKKFFNSEKENESYNIIPPKIITTWEVSQNFFIEGFIEKGRNDHTTKDEYEPSYKYGIPLHHWVD
jgi:hypothetical protein